VHVSRNGPQIVVRFTVANIAGAKYLLYFSRNEKFLELGRQVVDSMRDMEVADDEDEDHGRLVDEVGGGSVGGSDRAAFNTASYT